MENSQETEVAVPVASRFSPPAPNSTLEVETATGPEWHWCATCKLASSKPGSCPGCGQEYAGVPEVGVPDAPYMPRIPTDRSRRAVIASMAAGLATLVVAAAGIFLLASHGASTVDSGPTAAAGSTVDGTSAFSIGALHGTLRLQGTWGTNMAQLQLSSQVTGGAKVKTVLSIGKGSETVLIGTFASTDPSTVLNQFVITQPQNTTDASGNKLTAEPSRDVSIAGYTAVAQDFELRNPKGGLLSRGTLYAVNAGDQVVVIRTSVAPNQASDLAGLEQALTNVG